MSTRSLTFIGSSEIVSAFSRIEQIVLLRSRVHGERTFYDDGAENNSMELPRNDNDNKSPETHGCASEKLSRHTHTLRILFSPWHFRRGLPNDEIRKICRDRISVENCDAKFAIGMTIVNPT